MPGICNGAIANLAALIKLFLNVYIIGSCSLAAVDRTFCALRYEPLVTRHRWPAINEALELIKLSVVMSPAFLNGVLDRLVKQRVHREVSDVFGIDTCYTTSLAVIDHQGRLLADERKLLVVEQGKRGLRQPKVYLCMCKLPLLAVASENSALKLKILLPVINRGRKNIYAVFTASSLHGHWPTLHFFGPYPIRRAIFCRRRSAAVSWTDFYVLHVSGGPQKCWR